MKNIRIKTGDLLYPKLLSEIEDRPETLNFRGKIEALEKPCISIVGTRRPSAYGLYCCKKIIEEIAGISDVCIVSGLALGIDSCAHEIAIKNGLHTIAVLGSGIDNIYPKNNIPLSERIVSQGGILSEYPNDEGVRKYYFPQRNRIISGLSHATIAIEAPEKSGTLITMKIALNQNRLCLCVPGDIDRENSIGVLKLIQNGEAYPVSSGREVISYLRENNFLFNEEVELKTSKKSILVLKDKFENLIYSKLNFGGGLSIVDLCKKSGLDISGVLTIISKLEIKGLIRVHSGLYYKL